MQDADAIKQRNEGHQEEERAGEVTVHAPTVKRVHNARHAHYAECDSPDDGSPTVADGRSPRHDNRNGGKPIQQENAPPA